MLSDLAFKTAFFISLLGHCLFFGIHSRNPPLSKDKIIPEEITLNLEIEPPALVPKIDVMGDEKKFKDEVEPKERSAEIIGETSYSELFKPRLKVNQPAQEEMLRYQDMVKQRIEEARRYPSWARKQRIEGIVLVSFIVLANGQANEIILIRSCGARILDEEAINTIKRAGPFAPISKGIGADFIQMDVSLVFNLH